METHRLETETVSIRPDREVGLANLDRQIGTAKMEKMVRFTVVLRRSRGPARRPVFGSEGFRRADRSDNRSVEHRYGVASTTVNECQIWAGTFQRSGFDQT